MSSSPLHDVDLPKLGCLSNHNFPWCFFSVFQMLYLSPLATSPEMYYGLPNSASTWMNLSPSVHSIGSSSCAWSFPQRIGPPISQELETLPGHLPQVGVPSIWKVAPPMLCSDGRARQGPTTTSSVSPTGLVPSIFVELNESTNGENLMHNNGVWGKLFQGVGSYWSERWCHSD